MPIQLSPDRFIQFRYDPDYLKEGPDLGTDEGSSLLGLENCRQSDLVIDGGNVVRWQDAAVLTDKVYQENPGFERPRLREKLQTLLEVERLVVIPKESGDLFGHSDGVLRFVDGETLLVNDYAQVNLGYGERLVAVLKRHCFQTIPFPYCPTDRVVDGIPSAEGVYINFLQTEDTILVPTFGQAEDDPAAWRLESLFPHCRVVPVPCRELATEGGVLNCVTWNIKTTSR